MGSGASTTEKVVVWLVMQATGRLGVGFEEGKPAGFGGGRSSKIPRLQGRKKVWTTWAGEFLGGKLSPGCRRGGGMGGDGVRHNLEMEGRKVTGK